MTPAGVRRILRRQGMPPEEIRTVLSGSDPIVVHQVLELHRERLGEWYEERLRQVASIEGLLGGSRQTEASRSPAAVRSHVQCVRADRFTEERSERRSSSGSERSRSIPSAIRPTAPGPGSKENRPG